MKLGDSPPTNDEREIAALVQTLHETAQRLEELTEGEVDTISDREGRTLLLRHVQEQLRRNEAVTQAGILNSLPAHVALLDPLGVIVVVNDTWRHFATENAMIDPSQGVGRNYLEICDQAVGPEATEASLIADGIRSVLSGRSATFSIEYSCHSPAKERWFLMVASSLVDNLAGGAIITHTNISERKMAERSFIALSDRTSQREHLLITMLSAIDDFTYIFDRQGRFLFVNEPLLKLWDIPLEQAVGKDFFELGYPTDLAHRLQSQIQHVLATKTRVTDETSFVSASGVLGYYEYILSPVVAADGTAEFVVGSTRDISERTRAKLEVSASNEKFQLLADNITDAFWIRSPDMREVLYVSPAFETIWGRSVETLYAHPGQWSEFVVPEDRERVQKAFAGLTRDTSRLDLEYGIARPDGETRWVRARGFQVRDEHGTLIRNIGIITDITDRRLSEIALGESQARLRKIFDGLGPSMFVALLTPDGILVEVNRSPLEAAGLEAEDVIGKHFADAHWWTYSPEVQQQVRDAITRAAGGEASRYDVRTKGANGAFIDIDFSLQPMRDENGKVVFLIPSASVITERKQAESALRQSQKMEAVGQLAAGVAHEFNNILQMLLSMTTIIRSRAVNPEAIKIASEMELQIQRGASVTRQLLLSSRQPAGAKTSFDLGEQVVIARDLLRRLIPQNIQLFVDIEREQSWINGDIGQIEQVLLNLVINARDAMPDGGAITLRVTSTAAEVALEVQDDGHGFDAKTRERIFEPFFTTKAPGKGTGLGLAVVYGIVEQHGGRLEVDSKPGVGSLFRVILPRTSRPAAEETAAIRQPETPGSGTILLVEDEDQVREGLIIVLELIGYEVIAVASAEEALALPRAAIPDLLLTDVSLPGISGPVLASRLQMQWPALRVSLMTGYADASTSNASHAKGWTILQKPFGMETLRERLSAALDPVSGASVVAADCPEVAHGDC